MATAMNVRDTKPVVIMNKLFIVFIVAPPLYFEVSAVSIKKMIFTPIIMLMLHCVMSSIVKTPRDRRCRPKMASLAPTRGLNREEVRA